MRHSAQGLFPVSCTNPEAFDTMLTGTVVTMHPAVKRRAECSDEHALLGLPTRLGKVIWRTVQAGMRYRVTGLAAESAFFLVLSFPPLLFGLAGSIGFIAQRFSGQSVQGFRTQTLELATHVLSQSTIRDVLAPTLDDVLAKGRVEVMSIGFLLALWSGSRALSVFLDTVTIMYGHGGSRGIIRHRALSVGAYLAMLLLSALVFPLVIAGPTLLGRLLPASLNWLVDLYWPVVMLGSVLLLTSIYSWAVPIRRRWRADLPGALLTMATWVFGSWALRTMLGASLGTSSLYGPLSAPITLLMWLYLTSMAVLIGAAFNASVESVWPSISGVSCAKTDEIKERTQEQPLP